MLIESKPHVAMVILTGVMFCGYVAGMRGRDAVAVVFQGVGYISGIGAFLLLMLPIDKPILSIGLFLICIAPAALIVLFGEVLGKSVRSVWIGIVLIGLIGSIGLPLAFQWVCAEYPTGFIRTCPYTPWWR